MLTNQHSIEDAFGILCRRLSTGALLLIDSEIRRINTGGMMAVGARTDLDTVINISSRSIRKALEARGEHRPPRS